MEEEHLSLYDARLQSREISMLKTALPYVSPSVQKNLSMMIAFLQMEKTIEFFSDPENTTQIAAMERTPDQTVELLQDLRSLCSPAEQRQVDQILNVMQMISTYEVFFQAGDP